MSKKKKKEEEFGCIFSRRNFLRNFLRRKKKEPVWEEVHWTDEQKKELLELIKENNNE